MTVRPATPADAASIARIYNEGIADRVATFETRLRTPEDVAQWFDGVHPIVAVEDERGLIAFGATFTYRPRECYRGIAEASLYVAREARRQGVGRVCMTALIEASRKAGLWKLVSRVFTENTASRALIKSLGFREAGIYEKHGKLDDKWRDVVIVELLIPSNL
jgi:phosphinothricin acetyltransferase